MPGIYPEGHGKNAAPHSQNSSRPLIPAIHVSSSPCFDTPALTPDFCQLVAGLASWDIRDAYPPRLPLEAGRFSPGENMRVRGSRHLPHLSPRGEQWDCLHSSLAASLPTPPNSSRGTRRSRTHSRLEMTVLQPGPTRLTSSLHLHRMTQDLSNKSFSVLKILSRRPDSARLADLCPDVYILGLNLDPD